MRNIDQRYFNKIIHEAWREYDASRPIESISDISARVSTNHVYKVLLENGQIIIAKLSYFGQFEHFVQDHRIINILSNNLPHPFENFLSRALMSKDGLFVFRFTDEVFDAWVIFYRPVPTGRLLPKKLTIQQIEKLAVQFATFHRACHTVRHTLPSSSKILNADINHLLRTVNSEMGHFLFKKNSDLINKHCEIFKENVEKISVGHLNRIPVFIDWNIGNFSVTEDFDFYSRWDYDWFRLSSRMLDFYFISRIVSDIGDRTVFNYFINPLSGERFIVFLKKYHEIFPLNPGEIRFLKEVYRFFILNYVVHFGNYFFSNQFAQRLQKEAFDTYLPSIESFEPSILLKALNM